MVMPDVVIFKEDNELDYWKLVNTPEYFVTQEAYAYHITLNKKFPWIREFQISEEPYHDRILIFFRDKKLIKLVRFIINNLPKEYFDVEPIDKPEFKELDKNGFNIPDDFFIDYLYNKKTF